MQSVFIRSSRKPFISFLLLIGIFLPLFLWIFVPLVGESGYSINWMFAAMSRHGGDNSSAIIAMLLTPAGFFICVFFSYVYFMTYLLYRLFYKPTGLLLNDEGLHYKPSLFDRNAHAFSMRWNQLARVEYLANELRLHHTTNIGDGPIPVLQARRAHFRSLIAPYHSMRGFEMQPAQVSALIDEQKKTRA